MRIILVVIFITSISGKSMGQKMFENLVEIELTDNDREWIDSYLITADSLIETFYSGNIKEKYNPKILDEVFKVCLKKIESGTIEPDVVQDALGAAFGTYLNTKMGSRWLVIKDSYGTDLSIKFKSGGYGFPLSTVQKRLETKETGFFETTYLVFKEQF